MDKDNSTDDHDLLIRLDENVKSLTRSIQELNSNTLKRVGDMELEKASRSELKEIQETLSEKDKDVETRMRSVERFVYIAVGITIILQIVILPVILKFFFK